MEKLKIYIDRLKNEHVEKFKETINPEFLEIKEEQLSFPELVHVEGEAYLADDHLVANLSIRTAAHILCSICNQPVSVPIIIDNAYSTTPLEEVRSAIYDLTPEVRETVLLQVPLFAECNSGNCPERERIKNFLHVEDPSKKPQDTPSSVVYFPFADLDTP